MRIPKALIEEMIAHAREEAPNECCGVIAVEDGGLPRAARVHRAVNIAASPLRFEVDGRELLHAIEAIERDGYDLGGIYHSHTRTAPYPSQTDIGFAAHWPGLEWIIVGLADGEPPPVRSYLITGGAVEEVAIEEAAG
jgi:proteasome lid subunit RPN8/RPN11